MHLPTAPSQVSSYVIINVFKLQAPEHNFAWESCVIRDIGICGRIGEGGGALGGCAPQKFYVGSQCPHKILQWQAAKPDILNAFHLYHTY